MEQMSFLQNQGGKHLLHRLAFMVLLQGEHRQVHKLQHPPRPAWARVKPSGAVQTLDSANLDYNARHQKMKC